MAPRHLVAFHVYPCKYLVSVELLDNALTAVKSRNLARGRWWRWTKYELRDGYLRPAPGSRLHSYDPWKLWLRTRPVGRSSAQKEKNQTPYGSLLEMLMSLSYVDNDEFTPATVDMPAGPLADDSEKAILTWCDRYGLLGVLPHRVSQVTLSPQDGEQRQYIRISVGWTKIVRDCRNPLTPAGRPNAIVQGLRSPVLEVEPISKTWARFFPETPLRDRETFAYPQPLTESFWKLYAEPLHDFLSAARALRELLSALRIQKSARLREAHAALTGGLPTVINALVAPVGLCAQEKRSSIGSISLVSGSLFASLALMLLEDLLRGRALQCPCGKLFVSKAYQARYCSKRCRWRFEQRNFRKRSALRSHT
jgi:hypothetical protein